jgi:polysaccharide pyruvyl transferase WcaK-like protein
MYKRMKKPVSNPRIVIWGGWYGSRNVGDRLLLITIADILFENNDKIDLTILSAKPEFVREYFVCPDNSTYRVIKPKKNFLKLLFLLATCDLLIFGGAVPFYDQYKHAFDMTIITLITKIFRRPYFLWCNTSYEIKRPIIRTIYKKIIDGAIEVTCRDKYSLNIFSGLGIVHQPEIVQDPAFSLKNIDQVDAERIIHKYVPKLDHPKLFALTPRTLRTKNAEAQTHYNEKTNEEIQHQFEVYSIAVDWLLDKGYTPIFIPMNTYLPDDDRIIAKKIIESSKKGKDIILIDEIVMPRTAPALYSYCKGSLVSRVHGSVTSFLGNCAPIMYGFEKKHIGIMESMGIENLVFDVHSKPEAIIDLLQYLENNQQRIHELMKNTKDELASKARIPYNKYLSGLFL